jgi:hypothetical protein
MTDLGQLALENIDLVEENDHRYVQEPPELTTLSNKTRDSAIRF